MANFLVLGAGFVAEPTVEYLNRQAGNEITVASFILDEAIEMANKFNGINAIKLNVENKQELLKVIGHYDLIISLVPAPFHLLIAKACIQLKVNMVTASYQTDEMIALSLQAQDAGIIILNEIGLDPGIDHLAAMEIIDKVHKKGDEVESFVSWCGGIPAPDDNDNPIGYKFSWEPRGAIMVLRNDATYQCNKQTVKVHGKDLMGWSKPIEIAGLKLECYPNRNSINYKNIYGIQHAKDILRGTLRYEGFCHILQSVKDLGLMETQSGQNKDDISWKDYLQILTDNSTEIQNNMSAKAREAIRWIGCFSDDKVAQKSCSIDVLCEVFLKKLIYKKDEKDMVVLLHKFVIKKPNGSRYFISSVLKEIGKPNSYTAMAKTVGYPVAMAAELIANNKIKSKGMLLPVTKEIYKPLLELLKAEDVAFEETVYSDKEMFVDIFLNELQ